MKKLIGVSNHDFRKGIRIGKIHLAYAGIGKAFCGRITQVETGMYLNKKWIAANCSEVCKTCSIFI